MKGNLNQLKFKKMARILRIVMKVFFWMSVIVTVLGLIGAIAIQFMSDEYFLVSQGANSGFSLSMDGLIRYQVYTGVDLNTSIKGILTNIGFMASLLMVGVAIILNQIVKLLKTVEEDRPFAEENGKRLKVVGIVLMLGSVLYRGAGAVVALTMVDTFDIPNIGVNFSVDLFMLLLGFMMLILSGIFRYGNYLQQEYDSTL